MFHVKHGGAPGGRSLSAVARAAQWAGIELDSSQQDQLTALAKWLVDEAIPAGGLGPSEGKVVFSRHIADSLLFAGEWDPQHPPRSLIDVGSGVGLPGLPLAIAWPNTQVISLDRSVRRADLARRAVRLLGLENVEVAALQLQEWTAAAEMVVCRGVGSPAALRPRLARLLLPGGIAVLGGSHRHRPQVPGYRVREVPESIMGYPVWLLSMESR